LVPEDKRIADSSEQITGSEERREEFSKRSERKGTGVKRRAESLGVGP
jgi:hypothetical protein